MIFSEIIFNYYFPINDKQKPQLEKVNNPTEFKCQNITQQDMSLNL